MLTHDLGVQGGMGQSGWEIALAPKHGVTSRGFL